jgi:hypothetical protein
MRRRYLAGILSIVASCGFLASTAALAQDDNSCALKFERSKIGTATYEAASVCDVDNNGVLDIVSGEYWFEGPDFTKSHKICDLKQVGDYYDDFSDYAMDVNGDGYMDVVTGGWWGESLRWRENPKGKDEPWADHEIAKTGNVERGAFWDMDGDGVDEAIPNCPGKPLVAFKLNLDANKKGTGSFTKSVLSETPQGHGLGYGDLNGDGRGDFLTDAGWYEAPADQFSKPWEFHPFLNAEKSEAFNCGGASVPMIVFDVNEDKLNDMIVGRAHDYGLSWYEQGKDKDGKMVWTKHEIDPRRSQYHDLRLVDIDKDGQPELITGKRYRAHMEADPGSLDPIGIYYFKINKGEFERNTIDYGPAGQASGAGIYFWVQDIDGNGWQDIVAPGKDGLYLFKNMGPKK